MHGALLGPFGELLTEDDLLFLERQIESASEQQRFHAYEAELTRLAERLQAILPAPVINITINTQPQPLSPGNEGALSLPAWYTRIYGIVRSLNHLLSTLSEQSITEGLGGDPNTSLPLSLAPSPLPLAPLGQLEGGSNSRERVQREIQQAGVSVRLLRVNFESQTGVMHPLTGRLSHPQVQSYQGINQVSPATDRQQLLSVPTETDGQRAETEHAPNAPYLRVNPASDLRVNSDPDPNVNFDPNLSRNFGVPIQYRCPSVDSGSLRKERIVVLFLSHWKRSAYAISLRAKLTLSIHEHGNTPGLQGAADPTSGELQYHSTAPDTQLRDGSLHHILPTDTQLSSSLLSVLPQGQSSYNSMHQDLASDSKASNNLVYQNLPACTKASHNFKQLGQAADPQACCSSMRRVCRQMMFAHKMISTWRRGSTSGSSRASVHQGPSSASPDHRLTYSPEQFLSQADGGVVPYSKLTLDLFMLGYLRLLECDLPADERKMRHLLCFEVFDHVGRYPWEVVRGFHAVVLQEIKVGRRNWGDGFDDIKAQFFGGGEGVRGGCRSGHHLVVPRLAVDSSALEQGRVVAGDDEEACSFITRSFAFWKQQEAELFHLKQLS